MWRLNYWEVSMAGKPNAQIIGGSRASLPIEVYAYGGM